MKYRILQMLDHSNNVYWVAQRQQPFMFIFKCWDSFRWAHKNDNDSDQTLIDYIELKELDKKLYANNKIVWEKEFNTNS